MFLYMNDRSCYNRIRVCTPSEHAKQGWWAAAPSKSKFKKTKDFVNMMTSTVLRDSPFSQNLPLKSADVHWNFKK
jgi:hypothetical protein